MKRILSILAIMFAGLATMHAQQKDSVVYRANPMVDSTLVGQNIFSSLSKNVTVNQSSGIRSAMDARKARNRSRMFNGYRIRIYFDNSQNARWGSESAVSTFKSIYPGMSVYRTFQSPYFKVTVGDFRTRADAQAVLLTIKTYFPTAFIVKEKFKYPALDNTASYKVDSLKTK